MQHPVLIMTVWLVPIIGLVVRGMGIFFLRARELDGYDSNLLIELRNLSVKTPWSLYMIDRLSKGNPIGYKIPQGIIEFARNFTGSEQFVPRFSMGEHAREKERIELRFHQYLDEYKDDDEIDRIGYTDPREVVLSSELKKICNQGAFTEYGDPKAIWDNIVYYAMTTPQDMELVMADPNKSFTAFNPSIGPIDGRMLVFQNQINKSETSSRHHHHHHHHGDDDHHIQNVVEVYGFENRFQTTGRKDYLACKWLSENCRGASLYSRFDTDVVFNYEIWNNVMAKQISEVLENGFKDEQPFFHAGARYEDKTHEMGTKYYDQLFPPPKFKWGPDYILAQVTLSNLVFLDLYKNLVQQFKFFVNVDDVMHTRYDMMAGVEHYPQWLVADREVDGRDLKLLRNVLNEDNAKAVEMMAPRYKKRPRMCHGIYAHCGGHDLKQMVAVKKLFEVYCPELVLLYPSAFSGDYFGNRTFLPGRETET